jgi:hypothetical protein
MISRSIEAKNYRNDLRSQKPEARSQQLLYLTLLIRITIPGRSIGRLPLSRFRASTVV